MRDNNKEKIVKIPSTITVKKFSELLKLPVNQVITELMKNGILATINEKVDYETAAIIAEDLGFKTEEDASESEDKLTLEKLLEICKKEKESEESLEQRPPIVTILGHVDHGKTTLLDTIRKSSVAQGESGGITQHINAYQVKKKGKVITFVDTPGHAAFSAMRERGVSIADIAILVVAADDGVRPQTKEVIKYLLNKKVPTIVAINKIDKPDIDLMRVKKELSEEGVQIEEWGGKIISNEISAKTGKGIDELLDSILLVAEIEDFKANARRDALGIVLESHLDPQKGPVSTVLIKTGTLKEGQDITAGSAFGRVRRMEDFTGKKLSVATPSTPISLIGLDETANTNDILQVSNSKSAARNKILENKNESEETLGNNLTSQKIYKNIEDKNIKKLNIILKADVQGSLEAIDQILSEIKSDEVMIDYIGAGVGNITESDVRLAGTSEAVIFGFNVEITPVAKRMAETQKVEIKKYKIIYELIEDIKNRLTDMLPPEIERVDFGKLKVLAIFKHGKKDMIVGGEVINGKIINNTLLEVKRRENIIGRGELSNLQQNKIDTDEVTKGHECGITFIGETTIKEDDILICFKEEIKKKKL
jgi:translation initiation factor IF-2